MLLTQPYFMEKEEWYYFVPQKGNELIGRYELTEEGKKIPEVVQSHKEYYEILDNYVDPGFLYESLKTAEEYKRKKLAEEGKTEAEIEVIIKTWKEN